MGEAWVNILERVLQPERPQLIRCLEERARSTLRTKLAAEARGHALRECEARIEAARAAVFVASDGVVPAKMTELEREWRFRARRDPEAEVMDLWAHLAPRAALDRKPWRDSEEPRWVEAALALAADAENVDRAEAAVEKLRQRLAPYASLPERVRWRLSEEDGRGFATWFQRAYDAALAACSAFDRELIVDRAERQFRRVNDAALTRFPAYHHLANDLGRAAALDFVWGASALSPAANPVTALGELWLAGSAIAEVDGASVVLWVPPLGCDVS